VAGALFNDSGPLLFVFGVFLLTCATAYIRGVPETDRRARAQPVTDRRPMSSGTSAGRLAETIEPERR
jgi:hypothetical protein